MVPKDPENALYPPPRTQLQQPAQTTPMPDDEVGAPINRTAVNPAGHQPARTVRPLGHASVEAGAGAAGAGPVWNGPTGTEPRPEAPVQTLTPGEFANSGVPMNAGQFGHTNATTQPITPPTLLGGSSSVPPGIGGPARTLRPNASKGQPDPGGARLNTVNGVEMVGGGRNRMAATAPSGPAAQVGGRAPAAAKRKAMPRPIAQTHDPTDRPNGGPAHAMNQVAPQIHDPFNPNTSMGAPRPANAGPQARGVQVNNPLENMAAGASGAPGVHSPTIQPYDRSSASNSVAAQVNSVSGGNQNAVLQPGTMQRPPQVGAAPVGPSPFGGPSIPTGPIQPMQPTVQQVPQNVPGQPQPMTTVTPVAEGTRPGGSIASTEQGAAIMQTPQIVPITAADADGALDGPIQPVQPATFPTPAVTPNDGPVQPMQPMQPVDVQAQVQQPMPAGDHAAGMHVNPGSVAAPPTMTAHSPVTQPMATQQPGPSAESPVAAAPPQGPVSPSSPAPTTARTQVRAQGFSTGSGGTPPPAPNGGGARVRPRGS